MRYGIMTMSQLYNNYHTVIIIDISIIIKKNLKFYLNEIDIFSNSKFFTLFSGY